VCVQRGPTVLGPRELDPKGLYLSNSPSLQSCLAKGLKSEAGPGRSCINIHPGLPSGGRPQTMTPFPSQKVSRPVSSRRLVDIVIAVTAGIGLLPMMLVVAAVIRLTMGSPVLFVQRRAGLSGEAFRLIKFRTMTDARDGAGRLLSDEQRVSAFGRLLRRTRIDELPELWNMLKGNMSLIGPRPLLPETIAGFGKAGRQRGKVRPGLTGWAQVHGNALLSDEEKLALDLWYIDHRSTRLDVLIVLKTVGVVLFGESVAIQELNRARHHARDCRRCS
jgi:lipopolysaccharide/colanic/teichoic acid biosynthesis glycosyltransferase